jgi:aryl-alcohol dehydrogenase-like predicted oxidoreductase
VSYENAEVSLGKYLEPKFNPIVSSKIKESDCLTLDQTIYSVEKIRNRIKGIKLDTIYLHEAKPLLSSYSQKIVANLDDCRKRGLFSQIGVSLYEEEDIIRINEAYPEIKVFQVPENVADRRLLESKKLMSMKDKGYQIVIRSVFLQGLLLMQEHEISKNFAGAISTIRNIQLYARSKGVTPLDICLGYVHAIPWKTDVIIGADNRNQLLEIMNSNYKIESDFSSKIQSLGHLMVDPRKW